MSVSLILRTLLVAAAGVGVWSGGALSYSHFHTGDVCPMLGPLPACYLVFAGYSAIVISALLPKQLAAPFFYIGWAPVFGLALVGAVLHTINGDTCPINDSGVPQCYMSLGLAALIFALALLAQKTPAR